MENEKPQPKRANRPMGLGPLASPSLTFVREFRWTIEGKYLKEHFVKNVKFDFKAKTVQLGIYEAVIDDEINGHEWIDRSHRQEKELVFTTYDGCGNSLYSYTLSVINIIGDEINFNYDSSDVATRIVTIKYDYIQRKCLVTKKGEVKTVDLNKIPEIKEYTWKMRCSDGTVSRSIKTTRPTLQIDEVNICHMNTKMKLPGQACWEKLEVELNSRDHHVIADIMLHRKAEIVVSSSNKAFESWKLENVDVEAMRQGADKIFATLRFQNCTYLSLKDKHFSFGDNNENRNR